MAEAGVTIGIDKAEQALAALRRAPRAIQRHALREIALAAADVARTARRLLRQKSGTPSRPGEPPARQSGALAASVRTRRAKGLAYRVHTAELVYWASFVEYGTKPRFWTGRRGRRPTGKVEPRPFLGAALAERRSVVEERLARGIQRALEETLK